MDMKNKVTFETLKSYLQTIYEADRNGGVININESAMRVLIMCNEIQKELIAESVKILNVETTPGAIADVCLHQNTEIMVMKCKVCSDCSEILEHNV
jgi:hypothetical protein